MGGGEEVDTHANMIKAAVLMSESSLKSGIHGFCFASQYVPVLLP
jgi:hypothetical protein